MREVGYLFSPDDVSSLAEKKLTGDVGSGDGGLFVSFNIADLETTFNYWEIIHATRKVGSHS